MEEGKVLKIRADVPTRGTVFIELSQRSEDSTYIDCRLIDDGIPLEWPIHGPWEPLILIGSVVEGYRLHPWFQNLSQKDRTALIKKLYYEVVISWGKEEDVNQNHSLA